MNQHSNPGILALSGRLLKLAFVRLGVLPFLLLIAVIVFAILSDNFLSGRNLLNVIRQSTYLTLVAVGQMFALLTGGFDLSVGTILAITSVVGATVMAAAFTVMPESVGLVILLGILAGVFAGTLIGVINGIGVAVFNVSPFMMSLGMASVGFGVALYMTGGTPVYGMPIEFGDIFGFLGLFMVFQRRCWSLQLQLQFYSSSSTGHGSVDISMRSAVISRRRVYLASIPS